MELPIVAPAPVVTDHAAIFRDLFENQCQFRHFQHDLTGLIVLPNKSLASITRCILESADKTNLSRLLAAAPWREDEVNRRRIRFMLQQTTPHRHHRRESLVVIDDTLCEHVGSLFDHRDRHDNHGAGTYPLAHNPVTSVYVSGPGRFPLDLRLSRRDEELTPWEVHVAKHFPDVQIPTDKKARNRLHTQVDPVLRQEPDVRARHEQCRTTIARAIDLVAETIRRQVPFGVVVFDAWDLAEELVQVLARRRKDWLSVLKADVVEGVTVRQLPWVAARPASLSPIVEQMLVRLRLLWRGTPQTGGHGSPERQNDDRRVAIDQGIVTANLVLGDIVLEVKASALFAQPHQDRRVPVVE